MKHIKIVLTLTFVVVVMMVSVFLVEDNLRGEIELAAAARANEAKDEVLEGAAIHPIAVLNALDEDETLDVGDTGITGIYYYEGLGYVYQAEFKGFEEGNIYMLGFDELGNVTGYKTLSAKDSPGYGIKLGDPAYWTQLEGLTISDLSAGNFDGIAGATFTTNGWKDSFNKVIEFHNNVFLGVVTTDITDTLSDLPSSVLSVEEVQKDGILVEYIYTVEFIGYTNLPTTYKFTVNEADSTIKSLSIIEANDTDIYGAHIADSEFAEQFLNMTIEDAMNNNFDDLGGATYPSTLGKFEKTFEEVYLYHRETIEGFVPYVEPIVDTTTDYYLGNTGITKVEENSLLVNLTVEVPGFQNGSTIKFSIEFDRETNNINELIIISQGDTDGIGDKIEAEEYLAQFTNMNHILAMYGQIDAPGGATYTSNALGDGLWNVVQFYRVEFMDKLPIIEVEPTLLDRVTIEASILYPGFGSITDVTSLNTVDELIVGTYEVKDGSDAVLGYIFVADGGGANIASGNTVNTFLLAINTDKTFQGFVLLDSTDTQGFRDGYFLDAYGLQYIGIDVETANYDIDSIAGSSFTGGAIEISVRDVARYYVEEVLGLEFARPASQTTANGNLQAAYPTADSFNEVYIDFPFDGGIRNIYEALDVNSNVIGYVYYGYAPGSFLNAQYTWGVDNSGLTQTLYIISDISSWDEASASEYADYSGSEEFNTSTFLDLYENIQISSITATQVNIDSWAGVTTTTGSMRSALEAIAQYHEDNTVGGGN